MQNVLIIIHLVIVLALVLVVLLQRSEGGGLGLGGGSSGVSGFSSTGRGQANALTRATTILAAAFFLTSILLTMLQTYGRRPASLIDTAPPSAAAPAQPGAPAAPAGGRRYAARPLKKQEGGAAPPAQPPAPANGPAGSAAAIT